MKKIRKPLGEKDYKKLMSHLRGEETLKDHTKVRLLRIFSLLYYSGCRLNELPQITIGMIKRMFETKEMIIVSHKVDAERIIYFSDAGVTELKKYFDLEDPESNYVITKWGKPRERLHPVALIANTNAYINTVLGKEFSSHSFRSGLITELAIAQVNPKVIQQFIGHKNVSTTLLYVKPSEMDIRGALIR